MLCLRNKVEIVGLPLRFIFYVLDCRFRVQVYISGLYCRFDIVGLDCWLRFQGQIESDILSLAFRFRVWVSHCRLWISGLGFRFRPQVQISGLDFRFRFHVLYFMLFFPNYSFGLDSGLSVHVFRFSFQVLSFRISLQD